MRTFLASLIVVASLLTFVGVANADLINAGDHGELFFDTLTGLYWYDPAAFSGASREEVDSFVEAHSMWQYASRSQILALYDAYKAAEQTTSLYEIVGQPTRSPSMGIEGYGGALDGFEGFYAGSGSGSLVLYVEPGQLATQFFPYMNMTELTIATSTCGAWLVDPSPSGSAVPEPSTLFLVAAALATLAGFRKNPVVSSQRVN